MPSICLNMIVKNESHLICDTLKNICENVALDYWVISDTGSTDNTIELIENFFAEKKIPGEIIIHQWSNFSHNRNLALIACTDKSDYILFFDADDYFDGDFRLPPLKLDAYYLQLSNESKSTQYLRKLIIKNNQNYTWRGVLHEFLESTQSETIGKISGNYQVISGRKGNRSLDKEKYLKDAKMLEHAFYEGKDADLLPRYAFYCAQSYRDFGLIDQAIYWYQKRIEIDTGWFDEKNCCYEQLGLLFEKKNNHKEALYYWQCGIAFDPNRAECWYHTARRHSWNNHPSLAYCFSKQASSIKKPEGNRLFLNTSIYEYWCLYEWCLNAYKLGMIEESYCVFKKLIVHSPSDLIDRLSSHFSEYKPYILKDSYTDVQRIINHLKNLNKEHLFHANDIF